MMVRQFNPQGTCVPNLNLLDYKRPMIPIQRRIATTILLECRLMQIPTANYNHIFSAHSPWALNVECVLSYLLIFPLKAFYGSLFPELEGSQVRRTRIAPKGFSDQDLSGFADLVSNLHFESRAE
jgi:hypothetical protein